MVWELIKVEQPLRTDRTALSLKGRRLEYFTIAWNLLEGLVAVIAGAMQFIIDLGRDLAIVAIELLVLISLGWCLSRSSAGDKTSSRAATASFAGANRRVVSPNHRIQQKSDARHSSLATHKRLWRPGRI